MAWLLLLLVKKKAGESFEEKACAKRIGIGMHHAMNLLGELHKKECDSYS
jgi:hypothetical protein